MSLTVFTERNFTADFFEAKCDFILNGPMCVLSPLWGTWGQRTMTILGSLESA